MQYFGEKKEWVEKIIGSESLIRTRRSKVLSAAAGNLAREILESH
jgi:hypothetical protein